MPRARTRRRTMKRRFRGGTTAEAEDLAAAASGERAQREAELEKAVDDAQKELGEADVKFDKAKFCEEQRGSTPLSCWRELGFSYDEALKELKKATKKIEDAIIIKEKFRLIEHVIKDEEFNNISNKEYIVKYLNKYETIGDLISGIAAKVWMGRWAAPNVDKTKQFENRINNKYTSANILISFKNELKANFPDTKKLKANFPDTALSQTEDIDNFVKSMVNYIYKQVYEVYTQSPYRAPWRGVEGAMRGGDGKRSRTKRRSRVGGKRSRARRSRARRTKSKRSKSTRR